MPPSSAPDRTRESDCWPQVQSDQLSAVSFRRSDRTSEIMYLARALNPVQDGLVLGRIPLPPYAATVGQRLGAQCSFSFGTGSRFTQNQAVLRIVQVNHVQSRCIGCIEQCMAGVAVYASISVFATFFEDGLNVATEVGFVGFLVASGATGGSGLCGCGPGRRSYERFYHLWGIAAMVFDCSPQHAVIR